MTRVNASFHFRSLEVTPEHAYGVANAYGRPFINEPGSFQNCPQKAVKKKMISKDFFFRRRDSRFATLAFNLAECSTSISKGWPTCNVTKTIDVKGGETTIVYDSSYNLFPTSVTNALSRMGCTQVRYRR